MAKYLRQIDQEPTDLDWDFTYVVLSNSLKRGGLIAVEGLVTFEQLHSCGATACALGRLPLVFPEDWYWSADPGKIIPVCKTNSSFMLKSAADWFDIGTVDCGNLFGFLVANYITVTGQTLSHGEVKPIHVAERIENFVTKRNNLARAYYAVL